VHATWRLSRRHGRMHNVVGSSFYPIWFIKANKKKHNIKLIGGRIKVNIIPIKFLLFCSVPCVLRKIKLGPINHIEHE